MSNEDVRMTQWAMLWCALMTGGLGFCMKWVGLPVEWWLGLVGVAFMHAVFLGCVVLQRGWMPKDKLLTEADWRGIMGFQRPNGGA